MMWSTPCWKSQSASVRCVALGSSLYSSPQWGMQMMTSGAMAFALRMSSAMMVVSMRLTMYGLGMGIPLVP